MNPKRLLGILALAAVAFAAAACGSHEDDIPEPPPPTATFAVTNPSGIAAWYGQHSAVVEPIFADFNGVVTLDADQSPILAADSQRCAQAISHVTAVAALPAIPDPGVRDQWQPALDQLRQGYTNCQTVSADPADRIPVAKQLTDAFQTLSSLHNIMTTAR